MGRSPDGRNCQKVQESTTRAITTRQEIDVFRAPDAMEQSNREECFAEALTRDRRPIELGFTYHKVNDHSEAMYNVDL